MPNKKKISRRSIVKTAAIAGLFSMLGGCNENDKSQKGTPESPEKSSAVIKKQFE